MMMGIAPFEIARHQRMLNGVIHRMIRFYHHRIMSWRFPMIQWWYDDHSRWSYDDLWWSVMTPDDFDDSLIHYDSLRIPDDSWWLPDDHMILWWSLIHYDSLMIHDDSMMTLMILWWCMITPLQNHVSYNSDSFGENELSSLFVGFHSQWVKFVFRISRACQVRTDQKVWNYLIL